MRNWIFTLVLALISGALSGQMLIDGEVKYGNEWIDYNKKYVKITVDEDGMYKLGYQDLLAHGFPAGGLGSRIQIIHMGKQIPTIVSSEASWGNQDYILFYGERNRGEMDKFQYEDWEAEQLNPLFSLYSDESSYYLSWGNDENTTERFEQLDNDLSGALPVSKKSYIHKETLVFEDKASSPDAPQDKDVAFSTFKITEGFGTAFRTEHEFEIDVNNLSFNGPRAKLIYRMGTNIADHNILVYFNGVLVETEVISGYNVIQREIEIPLVNLESKNSIVFEGTRSSDLFTLGYVSLEYPREYKAGSQNQFEYFLNANSVNNYIELAGFNAGASNWVFDVYNHRYLQPVIENNLVKHLIPTTGPEGSKVIVADESTIKAPKATEEIRFESFDNIDPEFLILTSEKLNITENGVNNVEEYANFRSTELGGGYKTAIINVEDLYEQFGYGIDQHSLAVKNFSNYIKSKWPSFKLVFIIGKGLDYSHKNRQTLYQSFVPTYGKPGSDNLMFCEGLVTYPYVGVGRLAANNQTEIGYYLDKVKVHATLSDTENLSIEERMWRKNVLHLSGGGPIEQELLYEFLNVMKDTIEQNDFAGNVTTFRKTSSDPVQTTLSQQILEVIDSGISMMTFFGHSSSGSLDFSIEDPKEYSNYGKLPIMLAMGCKAGDIHANVESLSEKMVLTEDLGAVAFVASSGNAYIFPLSEMGLEYYNLLGGKFYGQPFGLAIREILETQYRSNDYKYLTLHEQNVIHGDPAITLFAEDGPDYVVDFASISTGDEVGAYQEFIDLKFDIVNLGKGEQRDSLSNYLVHTYGNNKSDTIYFNSVAPNNRTSYEIRLNNPGFDAIGKNTINIVLDIDNQAQETPGTIAEENNDLKVAYGNEGYCFFVFDNSAFPIYPKNFAIVYDKDISLKASASNAFADKQIYSVQIDTTELFNSPLLESEEIESSPGLIDWKPSIEFQNNTVYYWRIIPKDAEDAIWNTSSFIYLEGSSEGWNQSHFYQWIKDDYTTYSMDSTSRNFEFANNLLDVTIKNFEFMGSGTAEPEIIALNEPQQYLQWLADGEIKSGVYVSVFDGSTGLPWLNQPGVNARFGSTLNTSWATNRFFFPFWTRTPEERELVIDMIEDEIPDGSYVSIFTIQRADVTLDFDYQPEEWASDANVLGTDLFSVLEKHGAKQVRDLESGAVPYIFIFRKGDASWTPIEIKAQSKSGRIEADFKILGKWPEGSVKSTTIGPASSWDRLLWNIDEIDFTQDETRLDIIGIRADGTEEVLFENVDEFDFDLSSIDAAIYPNLKLNFYANDDAGRTSAQMEYWRVLFAELPEAVLNTTDKFVFNSDTLLLGEALRLNTVATNVTNTDMDSLLVKYTIVDDTNSEVVSFNRTAPLKALSSVDIDFEYPTSSLTGLHQFIVEINPDMEQREQFDFNNIGIIDFAVTGDNINPILDVTFDGMRIMDGDIVSPTPRICVTLRDESDLFFIDNLSYFDLALQALPDPQAYPVDLEADDVVFTPADSTNQFAKIEFSPELTSGEYVLFVQGEDVSGNLSGDQDIEVRFQVIEESSISNVLNYPNPFSTSTQFIFTLTGNEVPDVFNIQIMTLSGKIVREITREELGNIRVGVNRTDFKWDGTDEYGNKLANGVYLYRVMTSHDDGEEIEHFNNQQVDGFFKKGFGKLVIMR